MVDKRKRLSEKQVRSNAALSRHALLIRTIELLISLFYKKPPQDELAHLKHWEREKFIKLGLAAHPPRQNHSSAKDIYFTSWDREKVTNFGLSKSAAIQKPHRIHHPKPKRTQKDLTPKISPAQAWKKEQNQTSFKNDNAIDDFFKILGYE